MSGELVARLREAHFGEDSELGMVLGEAADRIEELERGEAEWRQALSHVGNTGVDEVAKRDTRIERMEAALREARAVLTHDCGETEERHLYDHLAPCVLAITKLVGPSAEDKS